MTTETRSPLRIAEVVLRTSRFDQMRTWYASVLELAPYYEHSPPVAAQCAGEGKNGEPIWTGPSRLSFFRLLLDHPYIQVVALFDISATGFADPAGPGLHHMQLRDASLVTMAERYRRLKVLRIEPFRTVDHGPTLSFYYHDPDRNVVEIAASKHESVEAYLAALARPEFKRNPSGYPVDADAVTALICASVEHR
ncbi:VOC family protein [Variovorax sp. GT1P44]|uniref:VOC family protein n=1 Tax=Variovorax sp. GT1P44 TaxID=3443742 RepID=UPI003F45613B